MVSGEKKKAAMEEEADVPLHPLVKLVLRYCTHPVADLIVADRLQLVRRLCIENKSSDDQLRWWMEYRYLLRPKRYWWQRLPPPPPHYIWRGEDGSRRPCHCRPTHHTCLDVFGWLNGQPRVCCKGLPLWVVDQYLEDHPAAGNVCD